MTPQEGKELKTTSLRSEFSCKQQWCTALDPLVIYLTCLAIKAIEKKSRPHFAYHPRYIFAPLMLVTLKKMYAMPGATAALLWRKDIFL